MGSADTSRFVPAVHPARRRLPTGRSISASSSARLLKRPRWSSSIIRRICLERSSRARSFSVSDVKCDAPDTPLHFFFSSSEISAVVQQHNLLVLADEVYEAMVYAPHVHTRIATLPGMFDRTVTLGSAGKVPSTHSLTCKQSHDSLFASRSRLLDSKLAGRSGRSI